MKLRKWQRIMSWLLTLIMIAGTIGDTGFAYAADPDDEAAIEAEEADAAPVEEDGEEVDPDASYEDTLLKVAAQSNAKFAVFTVRADKATKHDFVANAFTATLDSVNGMTLFVVPKAGYEIKQANLADAIKVTGAYAENDTKKGDNPETATDEYKAANWVSIPADAYTIAKATKTEVDANVFYGTTYNTTWCDGYDFSEAWTVTLAGSDSPKGAWLDAYKLAYFHDHNADYIATLSDDEKKADTTIAEALTVTIAESKTVTTPTAGTVDLITGKNIPVAIVGAENHLGDILYDYSDALDVCEQKIDFNRAVDDWSDKTVKVELLGLNEKGEVVKVQNFANSIAGTEWSEDEKASANYLYQYVSPGEVYLNRAAVRAAYWYGLVEGKVLTITISENADQAVYVQSATDLVTFTQYDATDVTYDGTTGTTVEGFAIGAEGLTATAEAAVWMDPAANVVIPVRVEVKENDPQHPTTERTIDKLYYQVEGDADKTEFGAALETTTDFYKPFVTVAGSTNVEGKYVVNESGAFVVTTDMTAVAGTAYYELTTINGNGTWYVIPAAAVLRAAGKVITLSADTKETVEFYVSEDADHKRLAGIKVNNTDLVGCTVGSEVTYTGEKANPAVTTTATGKDFTFQVVPKNGYRVASVSAKMYAPNGSGGENTTITKGDFGFYTVPAVTGKVTISVVTEVEPHDVHNVSLAIMKDKNGNNIATTGQEVKEIVTGRVIETTEKPMAYNAEDFSFRIKPSNDKMVKAVSYTMGNSEEKIALTASKYLLNGICYYTVPSVTGNVVLYIEEIDAVRVQKFPNIDATITIGGEELKDNEIALVPAGEDFTFKAVGKNGAEVDTMFFKYDTLADGSSATINKKANAGQELTGSDDGTYTLAKNNLVKDSTKNLFLTAYTVRPGDEGLVVRTYKTEYDEYATALDKRTHLITSASIYAGGDKATADRDDNQITVLARVEKADGSAVALSGTDPTHEWTITDDELLTLDPDGSEGHAFTATELVTSKQKAGSDVMSYTFKTGFPNATGYAGTLPIEVKPLNTKPQYSGLNLLYDAQKGEGDNTEMTTDNLEAGKMIRLDKTTPKKVADTMYLSVENSEKDPDEIGSDILVGDTRSIQRVTWSVVPAYESTLIKKPYLVWNGEIDNETGNKVFGAYFEGINNPFTGIKAAKEEATLTLTAVVQFADGTETVVEDTLELVDMVDGYYVVAYSDDAVWIYEGANPLNPVIALETTTPGKNNANLKFRVFDADTWGKRTVNIAKLTQEQQKELIDNKNSGDYGKYYDLLVAYGVLKEITEYSVGDAVVGGDKDSISLSGTNPLTVKAEQRQVAGKATVTPNIKVGRITAAAPEIDVKVYEELPINMVKVVTEDLDSDIDAYDYPYMEGGLATTHPISRIATDGTTGDEADNEIYTGFYLTDVEVGMTLTLPDQSAFKAATINPKRQLAGWKVEDDYYADYFLPGQKITLYDTDTIDTVITAIWDYTYMNNAVNLYSEIAAEGADPAYTALGNDGTGILNISDGASIQTKIGYRKLNPEKSKAVYTEVTPLEPNAPIPGTPVWYEKDGDRYFQTSDTLFTEGKIYYSLEVEVGYDDMVYTADGLTMTKTTDRHVCELAGNGVIKGKTVNTTDEIAVSWTDKNNNVFSTFGDYKDAQGKATAEAATHQNLCATLTVQGQGIPTYAITINEDNKVSDLEVSKVMVLPIEIKRTLTDGNTSVEKVVESAADFREMFASFKFAVADETMAKATPAADWTSFTIKGLKNKNVTTKLIFDAVDYTGNKAHGEAVVTVGNSTVTLEVDVKNGKDNKDGERVTENAEMQVLVGDGTNAETAAADASTLSLSLKKSSGEINYPVWKIKVADIEDMTSAAIYQVNEGFIPVNAGEKICEAKVTPTALGMNKLTLMFVDAFEDNDPTKQPIVWYERDVNLRSYVALAIAGPMTGVTKTPSAEAERGFTVSKGTEAIEADGAAFIRVPYDADLAWGNADKAYTSSLKGYSASYTGKVVDGTPTAFKGWKVMSTTAEKVADAAAIQDGFTAGATVTAGNYTGLFVYDAAKKVFVQATAADADKQGYVYDEPTATFAAGGDFISKTANVTVNDAAHGLVVLSPVFGQENIELSGLPKEIVLDDAVLSDGSKNPQLSGSDRLYVAVGVTPYTALGTFKLGSTDEDKFVLVPNTKDYYTNGAVGFATNDAHLFWHGNGDGTYTKVTVAANDGVKATNSRTDHFTVAKVYDPALNRKYVGVSTLYVWANGVETPYAEIPVYLNGEFVDDTADPDDEGEFPIRYMERGEVLLNGARTVNGEIHYYQDGEKVLNGVVTLEDGHKILVKNGAQVTTPGYVEYENNAYYVSNDENHYLKVNEKFQGELDSDKQYTFYADENAVLVKGNFVTIEGALYYFDPDAHLVTGTGDAFTSITCNKDGNWKGTFDYVIGTDGKLVTAQLITISGKQYYMNSYGQKVTYAMSTNGKYVDPVTGEVFIISEDDTAVEDDKLAVTKIKWDKWSKVADFQNGKPVMSASVTLTSQKGRTLEDNPRTIIAVVEQTAKTDKKVTFKATIDLSAFYTKDYSAKLTTESIEKSYNLDENGNILDTPDENEMPIAEGFVAVGLEEEYFFVNAPIKPSFKLVDTERDVVLAKGVDYTVSYKNNKKLGATATVTIKGKGNYAGKNATATFSIKDPKTDVEDLVSGKIKKIELSEKSFVYNGKYQYPTKITVTMKDKTEFVYEADEDGEYTKVGDVSGNVALSIANNKDKGTATLLVSSSDKSKKKTFKITPALIETANFEIADATWGVKAEQVAITATLGEDEIELIPGQDFKASYKAKNAGEGAGEVKISGKGNFKKSVKKNYNVSALEITEENVIVKGNISGNKAKKVKVQVVDKAGNNLSGKMFAVALKDADGNAIDKGAVLPAEFTVELTAGAKAGSNVTFGDGVAVNVTTGSDIAKIKKIFKLDKKVVYKIYNGTPITLDAEDFEDGKIDTKGLTFGEDFEIVSYKNNVKKGTMIVTVAGKNGYAGIKTFKVPIKAKEIPATKAE